MELATEVSRSSLRCSSCSSACLDAGSWVATGKVQVPRTRHLFGRYQLSSKRFAARLRTASQATTESSLMHGQAGSKPRLETLDRQPAFQLHETTDTMQASEACVTVVLSVSAAEAAQASIERDALLRRQEHEWPPVGATTSGTRNFPRLWTQHLPPAFSSQPARRRQYRMMVKSGVHGHGPNFALFQLEIGPIYGSRYVE